MRKSALCVSLLVVELWACDTPTSTDMLSVSSPQFSHVAGGQLFFAPPQTLALENPGAGVAVGDFNGDGSLDIAAKFQAGTFPSNPSRFAVFLGTGDGSFGPPTVLDPGPGCGPGVGGIEAADLNNDLVLDLVMIHTQSNNFCFGNKVTVHLGDGAGGFTAPGIIFTTGGSPQGLAVGDFNEDGKRDLAIYGRDQKQVFIHFGVGNGTFAPGPRLSTGAPFFRDNVGAVVTRDLNGDGHLDLALSFFQIDVVQVFFGNGAGSFSGPSSLSVAVAGAGENGLTTGDFNEDPLGIIDLAVTGNLQGAVHILLGTGGGSFSAPVSFQVIPATTQRFEGIARVAAADFDGDGHEDLAVTPAFGEILWVLLGNGNGSFGSPNEIPAGLTNYTFVRVADFDGGGMPDLVIPSSAPFGISILLNASVLNRPPVADAGGPYVGSEGSPLAFGGTGSSDPDGDALTFSWDFGDGSGGAGPTPTHTYSDNGNFTVTLVVSDGSLTDAAATTATITNVPPTVSAIAGATILESETFTSSGSFTDPGADTWTATVDYDDGSGVQPLPLSGTTFQLSHPYGVAGTFTVTVTVTDDDGGAGVGQATVIVQSPQEATQDVSATIDDLATSGALLPGEATALSTTLQVAIDRLDGGNTIGATNQLSAFINQVEALVLAGRLTAAEGQSLTDAANRIIQAINSP